VPIRVRHQGALRSITRLSVRVGGVLRSLKTLKIMDNGSLRTVAVFVPPISLTISPPEASGFVQSPGPTTVTSIPASATPTGGTAPYSYAWTRTGSAILNNASAASVTVSETLFESDSSGLLSCTVTDALGQSASASSSYILSHRTGA